MCCPHNSYAVIMVLIVYSVALIMMAATYDGISVVLSIVWSSLAVLGFSLMFANSPPIFASAQFIAGFHLPSNKLRVCEGHRRVDEHQAKTHDGQTAPDNEDTCRIAGAHSCKSVSALRGHNTCRTNRNNPDLARWVKIFCGLRQSLFWLEKTN